MLIKVNLSIRTDGWSYVEATTSAWEVGSGRVVTPPSRRVALGSEDGHLALQAAFETVLAEVQEAEERSTQARFHER